MKNNIQIFSHGDFGEIAVLMIDGKPYFQATECAKTLGYKDPFDAIKRHTKGSVKHRVLTPGGEQEINFIPEGGLYRLIIRSKLPEAERFEKFVFDEVLPSIRKHGGYVTDDALNKFIDNPEAARDFFAKLKAERESEKRKLSAETKLRYFDSVLQSDDAVLVSVIAKDYGFSAMAFNQLLHAFGFQYKLRDIWLPYQEYADKGYTVSRTHHVSGVKAEIHTCFTQKGRFFLYQFLGNAGIFPLSDRTADSAQVRLNAKNQIGAIL